MAIVRAVGVALDGAAGDVAELEDATAALGMGPGGPAPTTRAGSRACSAGSAGATTLRRIVELAGRYRLVAQSRQRRKVVARDGRHGRRHPRRRGRPARAGRAGPAGPPRDRVGHAAADRRAAGDVPRLPGGRAGGQGADRRRASTSRARWPARRCTPPRRWPWRWPGSPGSQRRWCGLVAYSRRHGRAAGRPARRAGGTRPAVMDWLEQFLGRRVRHRRPRPRDARVLPGDEGPRRATRT